MPFVNRPIMTCAELVRHTGAVIGASGPNNVTSLEDALRQTFLSYGDRLAHDFFVTFKIGGSVCEFDMSAYGVNRVDRVEMSCGDGCWAPVPWWRVQDNRIIFDGYTHINYIRVSLSEPPAMITGDVLLNVDYPLGSNTLQVDTVGVSPILEVPISGYVLLGESETSPYWLEYTGIVVMEPQTALSGLALMGVKMMPWTPSQFISHTIPAGTKVQWGVPVPLTGQMNAIVKQSAAFYWAAQTGKCTSTDDRSSAMQLMNFWAEEAKEAWRSVVETRRPQLIRKAVPGERQWRFQP